MKIGMVNKSTIMNRFVLHTLQCNITHLPVITLKTNINIDILKSGGGSGKEPKFVLDFVSSQNVKLYLLFEQ